MLAKFFEDVELRSSGNIKFSEILNLGASDMRNYEAVLAYIFRYSGDAERAFTSPGEDFGCAGAALGGTEIVVVNDFASNLIDSEAKFETNSKPISIEVNRI